MKGGMIGAVANMKWVNNAKSNGRDARKEKGLMRIAEQ